MFVKREELQEAGASPELARILADELSRSAPGDLTRNPMAATLFGICLAALLITIAWLALGVTGIRTEVALLDERVTGIEGQVALLREGQASLEDKVDGLDQRTVRIEGKIDRLLEG